jgi:hypothetical protein
MTNENETPARTAKRTRFSDDDTVEITQVIPPTIAPTQAASDCVKLAVASHHKSIQSIAIAISKTANTVQSQLRQQAATKARFDDDTFFPRSTRFEFNLTSTKAVMETEEFKTASAAMTETLLAFKKSCKANIATVADLVKKENQKQLKELLTRAITQIATLLLIEHTPSQTNRPVNDFIWHASDNLDESVATKCFTTKKEVSEPALRRALGLADDTPITDQFVIISAERKTLFSVITAKLNPIIRAMFVNSWNAQLAIFDKNDLQAEILKQAKEFTTNDATTATAMEIDSEPTMEPQRIRELIAANVKAEVAKINQQQQRSKQKNPKLAKNISRGASPSPTRASSKNQTVKKPLASALKKKAGKGAQQKNGNESSAKASKQKGKGKGNSDEHNANDSQQGNKKRKAQAQKKKAKKKSTA